MNTDLDKVRQRIAYYEANFASWAGDTTTHGANMRAELIEMLTVLRLREEKLARA